MEPQNEDVQMADAHPPDYTVEECLDRLTQASQLPPRSRSFKPEIYAQSLAAYARASGLTLPQLTRLLPLLLTPHPTALPNAAITPLLDNLYPLSSIPTPLLLPLLSALGPAPTKPPLPTQISLLHWLLNLSAAPAALRDPHLLSRAYPLLFSLLDVAALRPALCALLARLTRRVHVRPHRIQQLLELCRGPGDTAALLALLGVFKEFYPEVIVGAGVAPGRRARLRAPDWEFVGRLREMQGRAGERTGQSGAGSGFAVQRGRRPGETGVIPELRTAYAGEESVTLEEVDSPERFVEVYERLEAPSQLASALRDPLLQYYLMLQPAGVLRKRFQLFLAQVFDEGLRDLRDGAEDDGHLREVLTGLAEFHNRSKESLSPLVQKFAKQYLADCVIEEDPNLPALMALLAYLPFGSGDFTETYSTYFARVNESYARLPPDKIHSLICSPLISLLWNWSEEAKRLSQHSNAPPLSRDNVDGVYFFVEKIYETCPHACNHTESDPSTPSLAQIYRVIPELFPLSSFPLPLPPRHLMAPLLASPHLPSLDLGASILGSYKPALETLIRSSGENAPSAATTQVFNSYILDSANLLWRNRAFDTNNGASAFGLSPEHIAALHSWWSKQGFEVDLREFGSVTNHVALAGLAKEAWAEYGRQQGKEEVFATLEMPVTQRSLEEWRRQTGETITWREVRAIVVEWLGRHGAEGIGRLMQVAMKEGKSVGGG